GGDGSIVRPVREGADRFFCLVIVENFPAAGRHPERRSNKPLRICELVHRWCKACKVRRNMSTADEFTALKTVIEALEGLEDEAARERILDYAFKKLGKAVPARTPLTARAEAIVEEVHKNQPELFEVFADLYDGARPRTDADKALVAGYWVQVCGGAA